MNISENLSPRQVVIRCLVAFHVTLTGWCNMDAFAQKDDRSPEFGLRFLQDQPDEKFHDLILEKIPVDLQQSLRSSSLILFRPEALPFAYRAAKVELVPASRPTDAKVRAFAASGPMERDLLEQSWSHRGVPLRWIMSANVNDIQFPIQSFREAADAKVSGKKLGEFVGEILQLEGEIPGLDRNFKVTLPWPEELDNGVSFSSNAKTRFTGVIWWFDRWDVVIKDDTVHILVYSRNPQVPGFSDGSQYFPAGFRKELLQRKVP